MAGAQRKLTWVLKGYDWSTVARKHSAGKVGDPMEFSHEGGFMMLIKWGCLSFRVSHGVGVFIGYFEEVDGSFTGLTVRSLYIIHGGAWPCGLESLQFAVHLRGCCASARVTGQYMLITCTCRMYKRNFQFTIYTH